MGHLKNGLRSALRLFYAEIRPFLGFGVGKVGFSGRQNVFLRGRLGNFFPASAIFFVFSRKNAGKWAKSWRLWVLKSRVSSARQGAIIWSQIYRYWICAPIFYLFTGLDQNYLVFCECLESTETCDVKRLDLKWVGLPRICLEST